MTPSEAPQPVAASTYPDDLRRLIDSYLATLRFSAIPETAGIEEAMRYSLLAGGKRIRPVLALATARSLGMEPDAVRRGRPTSHVVYGENVAILAGDGLFAEAVRLFCEHQEGDPPAVLSALAELLAAIGVDGMVGGQYIDVTTERLAVSATPGEREAKPVEPAARGPAGSQADFLRRLHALKTGRLIAASVGVVLALKALGEPETIPYRRFAEELGVLFQIVDDILDVTGSDEELGKPHGSDERHGKLTYVSLFGLDEARKLAAESHRKAHEALAAVDGDPRDLSQITDFIYTRQS